MAMFDDTPEADNQFLGFRLCCPAKIFDFEWNMAKDAKVKQLRRN